MKIRTDFVTNSSSSSFILGNPQENTHTIKDAKKYLDTALSRIANTGKYRCEYIIDLRYDPNKEYTTEEVQFVAECISWYFDDVGLEPLLEDDEGCTYLVCEDGEIVYLEWYQESFSPAQTKAIFDYAYQHYGQILLGNAEIGFYPDELYYSIIAEDDTIKLKCNHMG